MYVRFNYHLQFSKVSFNYFLAILVVVGWSARDDGRESNPRDVKSIVLGDHIYQHIPDGEQRGALGQFLPQESSLKINEVVAHINFIGALPDRTDINFTAVKQLTDEGNTHYIALSNSFSYFPPESITVESEHQKQTLKSVGDVRRSNGSTIIRDYLLDLTYLKNGQSNSQSLI